MELQSTYPRIRKNWVIFFSLLYLALPNIIMMMAWVRPIPACLIIIGIVASLAYYAVTQLKAEPRKAILLTKKNAWLLLLTAILVTMPFVHDGMVGLFYTGHDYYVARQAYYSNLVDASWPVFYPDGSTMTYYNGMYLIPAVLCRLFGWYPGAGSMEAQWVLMVWLVLGVFLAFLLIFTQRRRVSILLLFLCFFLGDPIYLLWRTQQGSEFISHISEQMSALTGVDFILNTCATTRFSIFPLYTISSCYTSNVPAILAAAMVLSIRRRRNFLLPLVIGLLLFSSPLGALACMPFALVLYDYKKLFNVRGAFISVIFLLLPIALATIAAVYYGRLDVFYSQGDTSIRVTTIYAVHGLKGVLFVFLGVFIPTLLSFFPLWRMWRKAKLAVIAVVSILLVSQIVVAGVLSGLNELWLKACLVYTFVLCVYLAYSWSYLGWGRILPIFVMSVFVVTYIVSFIKGYTGQEYVADDCNGHLYHDRPAKLPQKTDSIRGLLYTQGGESEKLFPGNLLPKARGCDYSRPRIRPMWWYLHPDTSCD